MNNTAFYFFKMFENDNYCLLYDGNIVDDVTDKLIDISEFNFKQQEDTEQSRKKVSFLLAECFQNIIRHSGKEEFESKTRDFGFFLTRNIYGIYFITSGNLIQNKNVANLKAQLNKVNGLEKDELKALYRDVLANQGFSQKGGAGLGLIEIARKSEQKIEFIFDNFNDDFSVFYNQIMLRPEKQISEHPGHHLIEAIQCHKRMLEENIIMIQKGDFSKNAISPILEILKKNLPDFFDQSHSKHEVYHVLVELLQNIARNGIEQDGKKDGIFIVKKDVNFFKIIVGNYVIERQKDNLEKQFAVLNKMSKKEIKKLYLNFLENAPPDLQIEMIDIARRSRELIQYNFRNIDSGKYFFTIEVDV